MYSTKYYVLKQRTLLANSFFRFLFFPRLKKNIPGIYHPIYSGCQTIPFGIIYTRYTVYICVDASAEVTRQEKGQTGVFFSSARRILALIFYREKDSAVPFPRRP